ncbi:leucine--tRNA ligase [Candidatus Peregrinibacteria bacterium]|nr:leucine--tRNA ligase [Candidatus Peregrinibacteria bacterium]
MPKYQASQVESKWQKYWEESGIYKVDHKNTAKPKYFILDMFPYPSGTGLHVGHPKGYIATDVLARLKMLQGFNVLHPMGWDAFGLPAENFALKNKLHPRIGTDQNIANYKRQLKLLGFTYDWDCEVNTTDPAFYKWTQWIFIKLFEAGLAYESYEPINWCPVDKTGLANEDLEDGKCERCGTPVEKKPMRQWVLKITDYADRMLKDIDKLEQWEPAIKEMQRNWIGRSEGAEVNFKIKDQDDLIKVFTTRVDTIFGCTYVVLAPEHPLVEGLKNKIKNWNQVFDYVEKVKNKSDLERTDLNKDKSGVLLEGIKAVNPFNNEEVNVYIADYVLNSYGTGAVMAVPAHDERDMEFAVKYKIEIKPSISGWDGEKAQTEDGELVNSGEYTGLKSAEARAKMSDWLEQSGHGHKKVNYKLKDWVFSRQRYWGEPIPIIHCESCGPVAVPEKDLPVTLPEVDEYEPSGTGESPLAKMGNWVNTKCPKCAGPGKRETNTMPQWAGSSWYYLRYIDPRNHSALVDKKLEKYWSPVDFYVGGAEHATRHLIYARFWHKFLFDQGVVSYDEPFTKLQHVGLIMGEDGRKMSKRWGNVINPDDVVAEYGADSLRLYEMFMGPFDQAVSWSTKGLVGVSRFLEKAYNAVEKVVTENSQAVPEQAVLDKALNQLHKTIKKLEFDIQEFKFNTAVAQLMIFVNEVRELELGKAGLEIWKNFVMVLSPFAPHIAEEMWQMLGEKNSIFQSEWPKYDEKYLVESSLRLAVQVNGKLRSEIEVAVDADEEAIFAQAMANTDVAKFLVDQTIVKKIYVKGKLVSLVVKPA